MGNIQQVVQISINGIFTEALLNNGKLQILAENGIKKAEDGKGLVLRFFQYGDADETVTVTANGNIYRSSMSEKQAELLGKDKITLTVGTKKIVTLRIQ